MSIQPEPEKQKGLPKEKVQKQQPEWRIPIVGGVLSLVPGLGQIYGGFITRGIVLMFCILSLYGLSLWRLDKEDVELDDFATFDFYVQDGHPVLIIGDFTDTAAQNREGNLLKKQETAIMVAYVVIVLTTLVYLWNLYDGYACAEGHPSPARAGMVVLLLSTLILGTHITDIKPIKAINEIGDVGPRLKQILWPWDDAWERDIENIDGMAHWETPCDDTPVEPVEPEIDAPYIEIDSICGDISGRRKTNGTREWDGTTITVKGYNFEPDEKAEVVLHPGSIPEFGVRVDGKTLKITPDENGDFEFQFVMSNFTIPSTATQSVPVEIIVRQEKEVGVPHLNQNFWLAFEGIIETVFLALMATAVGLVLAVPFSFLAARNLMSANPVTLSIYYGVRLVLNVIRSIEPLVWALIAIIWVGPGPFAGVIALTIHTIAALGKLYSESIEGIDNGPIEAIQATGANSLQTVIYAVVPQVIPPFVSFTIYRWDINVRMSTIIGAVGGGGIGLILIQWIRLSDYNAVGIAVWMIAIVVTALDYISARIRERFT